MDDSKCRSHCFPFENVLVRESIGSCHPTELSVVASVVHHSMECE